MTPALFIEIKRKAIHLVALIIPLGFYFFPAKPALVLLFSVTAVSVAVETARLLFPAVQTRFLNFFSRLLRPHEVRRFTGSTFILLSASLCAAVLVQGREGEWNLPGEARAALFYAFSFIILGDAAAAIVGKTWGRRRIFGTKTLEGTLACFATGLLIFYASKAFVREGAAFPVGAACAGLTALLEVLPHGLDDNFLVPPITCWCAHAMLI